MQLSRRDFLASAAAGVSAVSALAAPRGLKLGVTDWNLNQTGKVEALSLAKTIGFEGVEVSFGRKPGGDRLPLDNPEVIARYLEAVKATGVGIAGTCLDILHVNCVKNDKLGAKWIHDAIPVTARLKAHVMLLPFFGKCAATTDAEMMYVADVLKEIAPEARKAKIFLGLENTISAENNARIMDRVASRHLQVYYDVGNATFAGFDPVREIRWLGKNRICQIHLKDRGYLGEGKIDFPACLKAINDIGYKGYLNLETSNPSKNVETDMKRNLTYIKKLLG
jgi:L-ribulose-5-phosphate 3-epimerase